VANPTGLAATGARWMFGTLSPAGTNGRLTVLLFHRVLPNHDPLFPDEPDAVRFAAQMHWIKTWFNVLPLPEAVERLRTCSLPARAAAITFDDGYADNYTIALPILQRLQLPATFFIATGFLDGGRMFNDTVIETVRHADGQEMDLSSLDLGRHSIATLDARRAAIVSILARLKYLEPGRRSKAANAVAETARVVPRSDLMLNTVQLKGLSAGGMTIGAHTVSHPILSRVDEKRALHEMGASKERLEFVTGERITLFAYPNGKPGTDYTSVHVGLARRAGFSGACSTGWGVAQSGCDPFQIPRFTPWDRSPWRYALRLAGNMRHAVIIVS
jgi:peptidoglycan/xylan/chitin deacetylase (PgdA/CDA1 family)